MRAIECEGKGRSEVRSGEEYLFLSSVNAPELAEAALAPSSIKIGQRRARCSIMHEVSILPEITVGFARLLYGNIMHRCVLSTESDWEVKEVAESAKSSEWKPLKPSFAALRSKLEFLPMTLRQRSMLYFLKRRAP